MTPPNELASLLIALGRAGVELAPGDGSRLRHRRRVRTGWSADLPEALRDALTRHRTAILALLALGELDPDPVGGEGGYVLGERLGITDGLDVPTHPGASAWLIALGEALAYAPITTYTRVDP